MSTLIILIGLPGSGKSTLARHLTCQDDPWCLISTDLIRAQLYGDEATQGDWRSIWQEVQRQFAETVRQCCEGKTLGAIYDATNAVRKQRRQVILAGRSHHFTEIQGLWLDVPLAVCLERNRGRSRQVPEAVILRMHRRLTGAPPSVEEGLNSLVRFSEFGLSPHTTPRSNPS